VFLGFLVGDLTAVKEIGFAMAVALLLDVTVVRGLLLPALMSLLGGWNWWAPAPLRRLHGRWFAARVPEPPPSVPVPPRREDHDDDREHDADEQTDPQTRTAVVR
jgi:RND superfamily putative drug exporter